jgi:hypothetical protein
LDSKATDINKIQSIEERYLRTVEDCSRLHHIRTEVIRKEMKVQSVQNKMDGQGKAGYTILIERYKAGC